ncbi:MAG: hypothetical protein ACFFBH_08765 [Promethearchaeota archaeon]
MILQGLFNILELYSDQEDFFYENIDNYFRNLLNHNFKSFSGKYEDLLRITEEIVKKFKTEIVKLGFDKDEIDNKFSGRFLNFTKADLEELTTIEKLYRKVIAPIVYEIFLEVILYYIADLEVESLILNLKSKGFLPIEFILELGNLKKLYSQTPEKLENLRKYIKVKDEIIAKFRSNKTKIETLENISEVQDKLQLLYLIYRILDFFQFVGFFDFSHLKNYIEENQNDWLYSLPIVTLKNPDLYFCGIYLANRFSIQLKTEKINNFLNELYGEFIDEFEAPIAEATTKLYYFFKSTEIMGFWLPIDKLAPLIHRDEKFFNSNYLKDCETSQLAVIVKILYVLNIQNKIEPSILKSLIEEIEQRVTPEGIKHHRDGFVSSESTYYVIFLNYMRNTLDNLKDYDLLDSIITRIYRNLELINFSSETNHDLVSEIFYSVESLKLFNCIETKEMITHLVKYLFPQEVVDKIVNSEKITETEARFKHLKVNRISGETVY